MAKRAGAATKKKILEASWRIFISGGFENCTYIKIGETADVDSNLINYHFGGKNELARAAIREFSKKLFAFADSCLKEQDTKLTPVELYCFLMRLNMTLIYSDNNFARFFSECLEKRIIDMAFFISPTSIKMYNRLFKYSYVEHDMLREYWPYFEYAHLRELMFVFNHWGGDFEGLFLFFGHTLLREIQIDKDEIEAAFIKAKQLVSNIDLSRFAIKDLMRHDLE
ncbi:MAG: TetR/AcrR family transcriptional regulator [Spirochaetaceae bacterium]|nr:TetR/AcrR family transcriptional regulator [Spirochaetaceae bacterium]